MKFDLDRYGSSNIFQWDNTHLLNVLTSGKKPIVTNLSLIHAIEKISRDDFVKDEDKHKAFTDNDLEIGFGQNINKPTTVARMIEILSPKVGEKVLDIGAGSGWTAALMSYMVGNTGSVFALERLQYLIDIARSNLAKHEYLKNIHIIFRDGYQGFEEEAPFDVIHTSVAYEYIPDKIKSQLKVGGRLLVPTTDLDMILVTRTSEVQWNEKYFIGEVFEKVKRGINQT